MKLKKYSLQLGILAMSLSLVGILLTAGSTPQKILFFFSASGMGITAFLDKQKMFMTLQTVVILGTILAFFNMATVTKYILLLGVATLGIGSLLKGKYYKKDKWWLVGSIGLLLIGSGFATNAIINPTLFFSLILSGGLLIAVYAATGFFIYKIRISILWIILNLALAIKPAIYLISLI